MAVPLIPDRDAVATGGTLSGPKSGAQGTRGAPPPAPCVPFDADTIIHCAEGWGNRHGRFYAPATFRRKIVDRFADKLSFRFLHLVNADQVHPSIYARFAFVATRR